MGTAPSPFSPTSRDGLYAALVSFQSQGKTLQLEAVYQDTLPHGSAIGTVVTFHGSAGSHKDFKYIVPLLTAKRIRTIGINYPGFGLSEDCDDLTQDNQERTPFTQAILDGLGLNNRLVFLGHSRGAENALLMTLSNIDSTIGTIMINPNSLRKAPTSIPDDVLDSLLRGYYAAPEEERKVMIESAQNCTRVLSELPKSERSVMLSTMKHAIGMLGEKAVPLMETHNQSKHLRLLFAYGQEDPLIPQESSEEYARKIKKAARMNIRTKEPSEEEFVCTEVRKVFNGGIRNVVAAFHKEGHYIQKHQAKFIAEAIEAMLESTAIEPVSKL